jgi:hypothetical protein
VVGVRRWRVYVRLRSCHLESQIGDTVRGRGRRRSFGASTHVRHAVINANGWWAGAGVGKRLIDVTVRWGGLSGRGFFRSGSFGSMDFTSSTSCASAFSRVLTLEPSRHTSLARGTITRALQIILACVKNGWENKIERYLCFPSSTLLACLRSSRTSAGSSGCSYGLLKGMEFMVCLSYFSRSWSD